MLAIHTSLSLLIQSQDIGKHIITLPGGDAPDRMFSEYLRALIEDDSHMAFWVDVQMHGHNKVNASAVLKDFDSIAEKKAAAKAASGSSRGVQRELSKKHFNTYRGLYDFVLKAWLKDPANHSAIVKFRNDLFAVFNKTAGFHSIDARIWPSPAKNKQAHAS